MMDVRKKAIDIADRWDGQIWKAGIVYALIYIGDAIKSERAAALNRNA